MNKTKSKCKKGKVKNPKTNRCSKEENVDQKMVDFVVKASSDPKNKQLTIVPKTVSDLLQERKPRERFFIQAKKPTVEISEWEGTVINEMIGWFYIFKRHKKRVAMFPGVELKWQCWVKNRNSLRLAKNPKLELISFQQFNIFYLLQTRKRFVVIPLSLGDQDDCKTKIFSIFKDIPHFGHANVIIIDKLKKEIERFDSQSWNYAPDGKIHVNGESFELRDKKGKKIHYANKFIKIMDKMLERYFKNLLPGYQYINPKSYIPVGLQVLDQFEEDKRVGDPGGFCVAWSLFWADARLSHPNTSRERLHEKVLFNIGKYREFIRNYAEFIIKIRKDLVKELKVKHKKKIDDKWDSVVIVAKFLKLKMIKEDMLEDNLLLI